MKIKLDFITNSSSTAYIAMIPENLNIAESLLKIIDTEEYEEDLIESCDDNEAKLLEHVVSNISNLKEGGMLWGDDTLCFYTTQALLFKEELMISSVDIASDSGGIITAVKMKDINKIQKRFKENESKT